jgi:hypothetical protein
MTLNGVHPRARGGGATRIKPVVMICLYVFIVFTGDRPVQRDAGTPGTRGCVVPGSTVLAGDSGLAAAGGVPGGDTELVVP